LHQKPGGWLPCAPRMASTFEMAISPFNRGGVAIDQRHFVIDPENQPARLVSTSTSRRHLSVPTCVVRTRIWDLYDAV